MKKLALTILFILCASCASNESNDIAEKQAGQLGQQHIIALSLAAFYYCEYEKWPENLSVLEKFQQEKNIKLGVTPSWEWLASSDVSYSNKPSYSLYSSSNITNEMPVVISSGQNAPICNNGKNQLVGSYMKIGSGN